MKKNIFLFLGVFSILLGMTDLILANCFSIDIYAEIGILLPDWLYYSSPLITVGIGYLFYNLSIHFETKEQAEDELEETLLENEELIKKGAVVLKHSAFKQESGVLVLTNLRLIYIGAWTQQSKVTVGDSDFSIGLEHLDRVQGGMASLTITNKDGHKYKFYQGSLKLNLGLLQ